MRPVAADTELGCTAEQHNAEDLVRIHEADLTKDLEDSPGTARVGEDVPFQAGYGPSPQAEDSLRKPGHKGHDGPLAYTEPLRTLVVPSP